MKKIEFIVVFLLASLTLSAQSAYNVVVPRPASVEYGAGNITVPDEVGISDGFGVSSGVMDYITSELTSEYGIGVTGSGAQMEIVLDRNEELPAEGYELEFNEISILLSASSESGIFYGFQTFFQMLNACRQYEYHSYTFPCQKICDAPRFPWRAYMLDEARHFMGKDVVLNILDGMAALKMNVFHWHLTDDAGWRIEIKKYPLLTEVGSSRKDTQVGGFQSDMTAGKSHSGFYTQDEIREILEYARVRQIKVVPEIEMPGHASAAMDGNKIVNSTSEYTYINFDHDFISLEKAYSFEPVPSDLAPEYQPNIIGLGCQMWTEWANTPQDVYIGTFPRIAAFAETGWSEVSDKDFGSFSKRVKLLYPGWRASGLDVYVCE